MTIIYIDEHIKPKPDEKDTKVLKINKGVKRKVLVMSRPEINIPAQEAVNLDSPLSIHGTSIRGKKLSVNSRSNFRNIKSCSNPRSYKENRTMRGMNFTEKLHDIKMYKTGVLFNRIMERASELRSPDKLEI